MPMQGKANETHSFPCKNWMFFTTSNNSLPKPILVNVSSNPLSSPCYLLDQWVPKRFDLGARWLSPRLLEGQTTSPHSCHLYEDQQSLGKLFLNSRIQTLPPGGFWDQWSNIWQPSQVLRSDATNMPSAVHLWSSYLFYADKGYTFSCRKYKAVWSIFCSSYAF